MKTGHVVELIPFIKIVYFVTYNNNFYQVDIYFQLNNSQNIFVFIIYFIFIKFSCYHTCLPFFFFTFFITDKKNTYEAIIFKAATCLSHQCVCLLPPPPRLYPFIISLLLLCISMLRLVIVEAFLTSGVNTLFSLKRGRTFLTRWEYEFCFLSCFSSYLLLFHYYITSYSHRKLFNFFFFLNFCCMLTQASGCLHDQRLEKEHLCLAWLLLFTSCSC